MASFTPVVTVRISVSKRVRKAHRSARDDALRMAEATLVDLELAASELARSARIGWPTPQAGTPPERA